MKTSVVVVILIFFNLIVGISSFILGKLMNNHTMSEFIYFPNVGVIGLLQLLLLCRL